MEMKMKHVRKGQIVSIGNQDAIVINFKEDKLTFITLNGFHLYEDNYFDGEEVVEVWDSNEAQLFRSTVKLERTLKRLEKTLELLRNL